MGIHMKRIPAVLLALLFLSGCTFQSGVTNTPPTASAIWTPSPKALKNVDIDASGSSDADGDTLTYHWALTSVPAGSSATLPATTPDPVTNFYADLPGVYNFSLIVNDGTDDSTAFTGSITATNTAPVASLARTTMAGAIGHPVLLDARPSTDADGHTLKYGWELISKPAASALSFAITGSETYELNADVPGEYQVQLVVGDTLLQSDPVVATIDVRHSFHGLNFDVVDAEYSKSLDRIVMLGKNPRGVYVFDTATNVTTKIDIPLAGSSVSVSPDGLFAAVGHDGWISYIDLTAGMYIKSLRVPLYVEDVVLDGGGNVHTFSLGRSFDELVSINVNTEVTKLGILYYGYTAAKAHPDGISLYYANSGLRNIGKIDISGGFASSKYESPYRGVYEMCGDLWISEDGSRIFTRCGNVFQSSSIVSEDMIFSGALENLNGIKSLDHSSISKEIVAIPYDVSYPYDLLADTRIVFLDDYYMAQTMSYLLPEITTSGSSFSNHGRFVFYSKDGSRHFIITQADETSGLTADFAILASPAVSGGLNNRPHAVAGLNQAAEVSTLVQLDGTDSSDLDGDTLSYSWTIESAPTGSTASIDATIPATPTFTPDLAGDYIIGLVVNDGTVNSTKDTLLIKAINAGDKFLLDVDYQVTDAEYSDALDKVVIVSAQQKQLYMFDTNTLKQTSLDLPLAPTSVSIHPNGLWAAVGHNGYASFINLSTNVVVKTFPVSANISDIILDSNNYIHAIPYDNISAQIRSVNISTEVETLHTGPYIYSRSHGKLHPNGVSIYIADNGSSTADIRKLSDLSGAVTYLYDSPYFNEYPMCGSLWYSQPGDIIFTRCGKAFLSTDVRATDMTYAGSLEGISYMHEMDHSSAAGEIVAIPADISYYGDKLLDTKLMIFEATYLAYVRTVELPKFNVLGTSYPGHGRFVFYNNAGDRYAVIQQVDPESALPNKYGIYLH